MKKKRIITPMPLRAAASCFWKYPKLPGWHNVHDTDQPVPKREARGGFMGKGVLRLLHS